MNIGKLPNDVLERIIINNIKHKRSDVLTRAGIGEDCSVIDFGEYSCVLSSDPITGACENIGSLSVNVSVNDIASNGAEPIGIMMTLLAPVGTTEEDIEMIIKDASKAAKELNVEIIGGHTEITDAVNKVVISNTAIGKQLKKNLLDHTMIKENDLVLMTKHAGLEGCAIIAHDKEHEVRNKISSELIDEAKSFIKDTSVVKEGMICAESGALYMHDITEGGVLGGIWESSKAINKGILVYEKNIPIKECTKKICEIYDINPLKLISSGSMLIICNEQSSNEIISKLNKENIMVNVIGKVIKDGIYIDDGSKVNSINQPESDELYKVL